MKHSPKNLVHKLGKIRVIPKELLYYDDRKATVCVICQFRMGCKSNANDRGRICKK